MKSNQPRSVWTVIACILSCSHAVAQTSEPDSPDPTDLAGQPQITWGPPGELIVDASEGNGVVEVSEQGLEFPSQDAVIDWAATNMNGIVETDETGRRIGIFGRLTVYGRLVFGDANTETSVAIDDYMVAKLGGKSGVVIIDGQPYCLRENGCSQNVASNVVYEVPPEETSKCNDQNNFCVKSSAWKKEIPTSFFPIYRTIGSDIEQSVGGFRVDHHFCWKAGFIPWSCSRKTGANTLRLDNAYLFNTGNPLPNKPGVATGKITQSGTRNNTESIDLRMWSLFVSVKSSSPLPMTGSTAEAELKGVCGVGTASSRSTAQAGVVTTTAAGDAAACDSN